MYNEKSISDVIMTDVTLVVTRRATIEMYSTVLEITEVMTDKMDMRGLE